MGVFDGLIENLGRARGVLSGVREEMASIRAIAESIGSSGISVASPSSLGTPPSSAITSPAGGPSATVPPPTSSVGGAAGGGSGITTRGVEGMIDLLDTVCTRTRITVPDPASKLPGATISVEGWDCGPQGFRGRRYYYLDALLKEPGRLSSRGGGGGGGGGAFGSSSPTRTQIATRQVGPTTQEPLGFGSASRTPSADGRVIVEAIDRLGRKISSDGGATQRSGDRGLF